MPVWDISAASYDSISSPSFSNWGFRIKPDGLKVFSATHGDRVIHQYTLSPAWDITSLAADTTYTVGDTTGVLDDVDFKADGSKMYVVAHDTDKLLQYSLGTAWNVSTASYDSKTMSTASEMGAPTHCAFKPDGAKCWVIGDNSIFQYDLSTPWDLSTGSYASKTFLFPDGVTNDGTIPNGICFRDDGTRFWTMDSNFDRIMQYAMSSAWDVTTATLEDTLGVGAIETAARQVVIKPDGTKLYFSGTTSGVMFQYTLGSLGRGLVLGLTLS